MANEIDFLPFATGAGANVLDQTDYAAAAWVQAGFSAGLANSSYLNKVWRQSSFVAAAIATWMSEQLNISILDDGNLANFVANFEAAVVIGAGIKPAALVTQSVAYVIAANQYRVAFQRTVAPAALTATLPTLTNASVGQSFRVGDVAANAGTYAITVAPPAGMNIGGKASYDIAVDNQWAEFCWLGNNTWSVEL